MNQPTIHTLKTINPYWLDVADCKKNFEIRKDDRDFKVGDILFLEQFDGKQLTGNSIRCEIKYILRDAEQFGLMPGYCILGLK